VQGLVNPRLEDRVRPFVNLQRFAQLEAGNSEGALCVLPPGPQYTVLDSDGLHGAAGEAKGGEAGDCGTIYALDGRG
jgi:hypothetical protein